MVRIIDGKQMTSRRVPIDKQLDTADLNQRLKMIHGWYPNMTHPATGMLEYTYVPDTNRYIRKKSPIREIAAIWDMELLDRFLGSRELVPLIETSLAHYEAYIVEQDGYLILDPSRLGEPSSIAHSAFMILVLLYSPLPLALQQISGLADGILHQQRPDGSYKIYFDDLPDDGEEIYPGEAMLALLEAYRQYQDIRYLPSVERGTAYYDAQFLQRGLVVPDALVFFANWQSQACRLLFEFAHTDVVKTHAANHVFRMQDRITERGFYKNISTHPADQRAVEVACALEGLNDASAIARAVSDARSESFRKNICTALDYLLELQCVNKLAKKGRGGFGLSMSDRRQRIDIIGHAARGFMKTVENGIACSH
jgi:hypothetical protein